MRKTLSIIFVAGILFVIGFSSCKKDAITTNSLTGITFSTDTVLFDTVFTSIGSTTKQFKIYNSNKYPVEIARIILAKGDNSNFRLNINGYAVDMLEDVVIPENDSIFVFVEVTVDPNRDEMVEQDSVVLFAGSSSRDIDLVAFGQDVHLINGQVFKNDTTWTNDKPFLIYNSMLVDSSMTLTIEQGVQLYFHYGSGMLVEGTLIVNGSLEQPVVFQGDRLESMYDDIPGQWGTLYKDSDGNMHILGAVHFLPGSKENQLDYAEIRNALIGIRVDTIGLEGAYTLVMNHCKVENMEYIGLYALGSTVLATNCLFANCGQFTVALTIGGYYNFYHCTMANYWAWATRNVPSVYLNNYYQDIYGTYQVRPLVNAYFGNCIIYGSNEDEIYMDTIPQSLGIEYFNPKFDHCILKLDSTMKSGQESRFVKCKYNLNPKFIDYSDYDYQLDTMSNAMNLGFSISDLDPTIYQMLQTDLNGISRPVGIAPDLGAYERNDP